MTYKVHITDKAKSDMIQAADYIEFNLLNPSAADRLLDMAETAMEELGQFPERNRIIDDPVLSAWEIRFITINNYLAFYTIAENIKTVFILRFIYARRNWISILRRRSEVP